MKISLACTILFSVAMASPSFSATITTTGPGSAVASADRTATFTGISGDLSAYTEDGLSITAPGTQCCFSNVHYEAGGNNSFATIKTVDGSDFFGIEFDFLTGNVTGPHNVVWESFKDGVSIGKGLLEGVLGVSGNQPAQTILGWTDIGLMDELRVASWFTGASGQTLTDFGQQQAIALDNVKIDYDVSGVSPVPLPAGLPLLVGAIGMLALARRRKSTRV